MATFKIVNPCTYRFKEYADRESAVAATLSSFQRTFKKGWTAETKVETNCTYVTFINSKGNKVKGRGFAVYDA